jgi:RHS repeat-associated protein
MRKEIFIYLVLVFLSVNLLGQSYTTSFMMTQNVRKPITSLSELNDLGVNSRDVSIIYKDHLGRPIQVVNKQASPNQRDEVKFWIYNKAGRVPVDYSAYVDNTSDGSFKSSQTFKQINFYQNEWGVTHTVSPFRKTIYESSPLSRVTEQGSVGYYWQPGSGIQGHTKKFEYSLNHSLTILKMGVDISNGNLVINANDNYYNIDELFYNETIDEDNNRLGIYSDQQGKSILKVTYANDGNDNLNTYYVYDILNRLSYIVTPKLANELESLGSASLSWNDLLIKNLAFAFKYDEAGRLAEKLVSGADPIWYVYDNYDRPILEQDGNLRNEGKWKFAKFDQVSRSIMEGIIVKSIGMTREQVQLEVDNFYSNGAINFERPDFQNQSNIHGYTNNAYPVLSGSPDIYGISYYDNYEFDIISQVVFDPNAVDGPLLENPYGLSTGNKLKVLGSSPEIWMLSAYYYDKKYQLIQTCTQNHLGGIDRQSFAYEFDGTLITQEQVHNVNPNLFIKENKQYEYDHKGRLKAMDYWIQNRDNTFRMYSNTYNEVGQLLERDVLQEELSQGLTSLQSIDYRYNERGWLTRINQSNITNSNTTIDFHEVLAADEFVKGLILDTIAFEVVEYDDGSRTGKESLTIRIDDRKKLIIAKINDTADIRQFELNEIENSTLYKEAVDSITFVTLLSAISTPFVINMSGLYYTEFDSKEMISNDVSKKVTDFLTDMHITDEVLIEKISERVLGYFYDRAALLVFNEDQSDIFGMDILYNTGLPQLGGAMKYNGLISGIRWQSSTNQGVRGYGFTYDQHNQFTGANYGDYDKGVWSANQHYSVSNITYDANGNIQSLKRKGVTDLSGQDPVYGTIDDLIYTYNYKSNQLANVEDQSGFSSTIIRNFNNNTILQLEYTYDANGNLKKDLNKDITNINYNVFNKPVEVNFSDDRKLVFTYNSIGEKLGYQVYSSTQTLLKQNDYVGNIVYEDGDLNFVLTEEGRMVYDISTSKFSAEFFFKDNLGNVREVYKKGVDDKVEVVEEHHYYPFGMLMSGINLTSSPKNPYFYQGREFFDDFGFNLQDFDARMFDSQLGRWHAIDPVMQFASPYIGMGNNPVSLVDPRGTFVGGFWSWLKGLFGGHDNSSGSCSSNDPNDSRVYGNGGGYNNYSANDNSYSRPPVGSNGGSIPGFGSLEYGSGNNGVSSGKGGGGGHPGGGDYGLDYDPSPSSKGDDTPRPTREQQMQSEIDRINAAIKTFLDNNNRPPILSQSENDGGLTYTEMAHIASLALIEDDVFGVTVVDDIFIPVLYGIAFYLDHPPTLRMDKKPTLQDLKNNPPDHPAYKPPKGGSKKIYRDGKKGWLDKWDNLWVPDDHNNTHGPHWDVQLKQGGYEAVYPMP